MLKMSEPQELGLEAGPGVRAAFAKPAAFALGSLEGIVGVHVSFAAATIHKHVLGELEPFGLTQKQVAILWLIDENPEIAKSDLARLLMVERATVQIMVRSLEERDLIRPEPSPVDGRRILLRLTDAARTVLPLARAAVERHEAWLKERFSDDEVNQIVDLMKRVYS